MRLRPPPQQILLISTEQPEIRIAQLRDGRLFNLFVERGGRVLNNIYKGRVANVIGGMDAAFVDIGLNRNALIYAGDISSGQSRNSQQEIGSLVKVGDELTVQIARPPVGTKGARVTTRLSLAGRYVVLSSHDDKTGVSKRIGDENDRSRLRKLAEKLRPLDHGLIIRTEADGVAESLLAKDIQAVTALMQKIRHNAAQTNAPALLHREAGILGRVVRDFFNQSVETVWIDTPEEYEAFQAMVQENAPTLADRVHLYEDDLPLFEKFGIEEEIALAQERVVPLPHGGTLVIDETEALCAIDVNTGKFTGKSKLADTVLKTNLEAVEAAARQIRLRNLGGIIVIDFIDMERHKDRVQVLDALEAALKQDSQYTRIVQLSPSGLVEITRRRESPSFRQLFKRPCPHCQGSGVIKTPATLAVEARRKVREFTRKNPSPKGSEAPLISVTLHPETACAFLGPGNEYIAGLENTINRHIWLRAEPNLHPEAIIVETFRLGEIQNDTAPEYFQVGEIVTVSPHCAQFPAKDSYFIVSKSRLLRLENLRELQNRDTASVNVEITGVGRWFVAGKMLDE